MAKQYRFMYPEGYIGTEEGEIIEVPDDYTEEDVEKLTEELLKEAKRIISVEVDLEICELESLATDNDIEFIWTLKKFKRQFICRINAELKGR